MTFILGPLPQGGGNEKFLDCLMKIPWLSSYSAKPVGIRTGRIASSKEVISVCFKFVWMQACVVQISNLAPASFIAVIENAPS